MFHTIHDFITLWQAEAEKTDKILSKLTDDSLNKQLVPGLRTLGQLAWHILETPREMLEHTGLHVTGPEYRSLPPTTIRQLIDEHHSVVASVAHEIQTHWNNKSLHQTDQMYGETWTRSQTLWALIAHMIHHRGQMTVFMRIAGLQVPGIYGPSKEEWVLFGMEPPQ